jgi:2-methylisocitrate lyase-like PEP mutase family enzyme
MKRASTRLRVLIAAGPTLYVPGCYNAMSARVLESAGFEAYADSVGHVPKG